MQEVNKTFIGFDISKNTVDVAILINDGSIIYLTIDNNEKGFHQLLNKLTSLKLTHPVFCMEATSVYYEAIADFMTDNGYRVHVVNPLKIKHYARQKFNRTKTDKQDARIIAQYLQREHQDLLPYVKPTQEQYQTRRAITALRQLNKDRNAVQNRLAICQDPFLIELLKQQQAQIESLIEQLESHLEQLAQTTQQQTQQKLKSIPSVGKTTALVLTHYLHMYRFDKLSQFIAFSGLSPQQEQSGSSVRKRDKLSFYGNRILKSALYMPALVCLRRGYFGRFVQRLQTKNKPKMVIVCALMRKLATIAWHLWHKQETFNPERHQMA